MTKGDRLSPINSYDPFLAWLCDIKQQIKNFVSPFPQNL